MEPIETQVQSVVEQLFDEMPVLMGFSVEQGRESELVLANVETFPWTPYGRELMSEIAVPLIELMDEAPEARDLLRGRTFARRVH